MTKATMVIGGGIAGIQAALDLANRGLEVVLVERTPSIGGRMAQLDKTFPTNDCSICILAPKMADCFTHPNITTLSYSEVKGVTGQAGDFAVKVLKKARYVDENKCTGCLECVEKCPSKVPSEFEMGLADRKAIYLPFMQAVPRVVTIDKDNCIKLTRDKCGVCQKICKRGAIDYTQEDKMFEIRVGAIIVATGFDPWDPSEATEYGYGKYPNVYTGMEYERLINAAGPTRGVIQRRSDGKHPKKIAFIQCVGGRNIQLKHPYCCSVCCMMSTKEATLAKEHDEEIETVVFYKDIRTFGKGFYEYRQRGIEDYGVTYIDSDATVEENPESHNPIVVYDEAGKPKRLEVDMVVLATALVPRKGTGELAKILGVPLTEWEFFDAKDRIFGSMETPVNGIYLAGYCKEPMDIPDAVASASAAAAKVSELYQEVGA